MFVHTHTHTTVQLRCNESFTSGRDLDILDDVISSEYRGFIQISEKMNLTSHIHKMFAFNALLCNFAYRPAATVSLNGVLLRYGEPSDHSYLECIMPCLEKNDALHEGTLCTSWSDITL